MSKADSRQPASPRREVPSNHREGDPPSSFQVHVSGFPSYTRAEDLKNAFSTYGNVKVKLFKRHAVITFPDRDAMEYALANSDKIVVYGTFLAIRPYTAQPRKENDRARPPFIKVKEKNNIIEPQKLNLSGDFSEQLQCILNAIRLTQEDVAHIASLYDDLEAALTTYWPGCGVLPFGSITTGLGIKSSDADCHVQLPERLQPDGTLVNRAKRILQRYPKVFSEVFAIPTAHTPIVKLFHLPTQTQCDLSFKTLLGSRNSQLIAFLLHANPNFLPVAVVLRYWAKVHGLSGSGKLSNYALTMLYIFYLQQLDVLPTVEWLQRQGEEVIVDHWNTGFLNDYNRLPKKENIPLDKLLGEFFEYYSRFDFDRLVICPLTGQTLVKDDFTVVDSLPEVMSRYKQNLKNNKANRFNCTTAICIQDPFELSHNIGSTVSKKLAAEIKAYFKFAAEAYCKGATDNYSNFLKTILLNKPVTPVMKSEIIKAKIYGKDLESLAGDDWKDKVRSVINTLFEDICCAKLELVDKEVTESEKEVETYSFTLNKAIWKRKKFSKVYSHMEGSFIQKQMKITKEIINTERETKNLQLQLILGLPAKSRVVFVCVRYIKGDKSDFSEFGKMFITMVRGWFHALIQPLVKRNCDVDVNVDETANSDANNSVESDNSGNDANVQSNSTVIDTKTS